MKNHTPALIKTGKIKTTFKSFFLGNSVGAKATYYCARHKTEDIYILWIETARFGTNFCFPCVLEEQGDPMVYITGGGAQQKAKNRALIHRWGLFVTPSNIFEEFDYGELTADNFYTEYAKYKDIVMCREIKAMEPPQTDAGQLQAPDAGEDDVPAPEEQASQGDEDTPQA